MAVADKIKQGIEEIPELTLIGEPTFVISSHTAPGTIFCCAAEAMLLGLEPEQTRELTLVSLAQAVRESDIGDRVPEKVLEESV